MKNKNLLLSVIQLIFVVDGFCSLDQTSADCAAKIVELRWDIESAKATGKAAVNYCQEYLKHLGQVKVAQTLLSKDLNIPSKDKSLLEKIRVELVDKANSIRAFANKVLSKSLPGYTKELGCLTQQRVNLRKKLIKENCDQKALLKAFANLWKNISALKVNVLKAEKSLLENKYDILNLEFVDSIEKYSKEYKKYLQFKEKAQKRTLQNKAVKAVKEPKLKGKSNKKTKAEVNSALGRDNKKMHLSVKKEAAKKPSLVAQVSSPAHKKHLVSGIDWGMRLTRELDNELKKTSQDLAQMSDKLTKELADLERIGIELFGAQRVFAA